MLAVLSPAKKLDGSTPPPTARYSEPELADQTEMLIPEIKKLSRPDLQRLMKLSPKLADIAFERHRRLGGALGPENAKQSVFAFKGDTYVGLDPDSLEPEDLAFAQDHLRILSGLYGLLRPLDLIQSYRLEMATKLANPRGEDLYDFWGGRIADAVNKALPECGGPVINLASKEYFKALKPRLLHAEVITPVFKDGRGGSYRVMGLFAKRARGMMARYIVRRRLEHVEDLKNFGDAGYRYNAKESSGSELVFLRDRD